MEEIRNSPFINGEDRISRLPDNLIHHIMSFIDTKYAVQTCVLSKRWIDTWKSLPFLIFNRNSFSREDTERFIEFVYMVFMFRDHANIQKLSVGWERAASGCPVIVNVNRWILFAVKQDVQEITIRIGESHVAAYEIPHRLLNCKSLRKLEIHMYGNGRYTDIILPKSMNLAQLKVLILEGLSFSNVELYKKLMSSCPVLENLTVVDCDLQTDNQRNLIVDSVSLKDFEYTCWLNYTIPNSIKLCAPKLECFNCRFFLTQDFSLENYSPLSSVAFHMVLEDENAKTYSKLPSTEKIVYAKRMMKYLGAVYMVKEMTLSSGFLEVLSQAPDLLDCQPLAYVIYTIYGWRCGLQSVACGL